MTLVRTRIYLGGVVANPQTKIFVPRSLETKEFLKRCFFERTVVTSKYPSVGVNTIKPFSSNLHREFDYLSKHSNKKVKFKRKHSASCMLRPISEWLFNSFSGLINQYKRLALTYFCFLRQSAEIQLHICCSICTGRLYLKTGSTLAK